MRPDIKLGIVISMVVVLVAGSYFMYRANDKTPISLASTGAESQKSASKEVASPSGKKAAKTPAPKPSPERAARKHQEPTQTAQKNRQAARKASNPQTTNNSRRNAGSNLKSRNRRAPARTTGARRVQPKAKTPSKQLAHSSKTTNNAAQKRTPINPDTAQKLALKPQNTAAKNRGTSTPRVGEQKQPVSLAARPAHSGSSLQRQSKNGHSIETHRVQPRDTFASLAQRYYGDAKHARFLINSNPHLGTTGRLVTGQVVKIPSLPPATATTNSAGIHPGTPLTGRTYKVKSGDSFYKIAANVLGDASRWNELFELNKKLVKGDPKRLQIGTELRLPNQ